MENIDWSKAPKEATHYAPETAVNLACWIKYECDECKYITVIHHASHKNNEVWIHGLFNENDERIIERPKPIYTQAMCDAGECPCVGSQFTVINVELDSRVLDFKERNVTVLAVTVSPDDDRVITFSHPTMGLGCGAFHKHWVKAIDNRTNTEKAIDDIYNAVNNDDEWQGGCDDLLEAIIAGKVHGVTFKENDDD